MVARSAQQSPHCTGGGNGSDKGGNARSDRAKTAHILRDRSVTVFVRSRRRCPADTFGATFLCQKVVNLLLAGKNESKVRGYFPKNRSGNFSLLKILFLVLLARSKWGGMFAFALGLFVSLADALDTSARHNQAGACFCPHVFVSLSS